MSESLDLGLQEIWLDCDKVSLMCSSCGDELDLFTEDMNLSNLVHTAIAHRRNKHSLISMKEVKT